MRLRTSHFACPFVFPLLSENLLVRLVWAGSAVPVHSVWTDFDSVRSLPRGLENPSTKQISFQTFIRTSKGQQRCGEEFQCSARLHSIGNLCGSARTASAWPRVDVIDDISTDHLSAFFCLMGIFFFLLFLLLLLKPLDLNNRCCSVENVSS